MHPFPQVMNRLGKQEYSYRQPLDALTNQGKWDLLPGVRTKDERVKNFKFLFLEFFNFVLLAP